MYPESICRIALTMVPELGPVRARSLVDHFGNAASIFQAKKKELAGIEGMGDLSCRNLKEWNDWKAAEREFCFTQKHQIQCLFLTDLAYPRRLLHCYDPPTLLYYKGTADLNVSRIISIIGTRNHTEYGKQVAEQIIRQLTGYPVLVVSGLAFGIDAVAHKTALMEKLATVGVLAHGLDTIYPHLHKSLAKDMLLNGGLLTEFRINNQPDKHHFPKRNRIVAGMSDATIVIETAVKGGSMITASLAHDYNRDLFAIPGKITDPKSSGCLKLIQQNKAILLTSGEQLAELMGWHEKKKTARKQTALFIELNEEEKRIVDLLKQHGPASVDALYLASGLSSSTMAACMLNLELNNVIGTLPGKIYTLL